MSSTASPEDAVPYLIEDDVTTSVACSIETAIEQELLRRESADGAREHRSES